MTNRSYKVRFRTTEVYKGKRGTTYTVRWSVNGQRHGETFKTSAAADSFRATLLVAANNGEPFDQNTGRPVSHAAPAAGTTWYDFALQYVDMKWPRISANNRISTAKALTKATLALLRTEPVQYEGVDVRKALREYAFNKNRRDEAPPEYRAILAWVRRNSLPMSAWEDSKHVDAVLQALDTMLDGTQAAASSAKRYRRILNVVLNYAVRQNVLQSNPMPKGKGENTAPRTSGAVDKRSLLNPHQVAALLTWIAARPRTGHRLTAFFATLYYAGLRPEDAVLPATGWGELRVHTAQPEVGSHWTDDGETHETRHLKGRASGDTRTVPVHPALVEMLRALVARDELKPGDLLFPGEKGGLLAGSVYRRAWAKAREAVLPEHEFKSPVGKRVYDLRHTCLTTWLNNGIPPAQVADWAGNSVPVLLSTYARCITGQTAELQRRIEGPQMLPRTLGSPAAVVPSPRTPRPPGRAR
ncbi:tyrosine-type recombinase/integrase [Streptomyces sp. NPDC014773]|uniref:tyrosine-type recombinase/integrase n=1 Tax=Streptomyces sp. NPDC014773 TaxID=3364908 RepID=UPI0036FFFEAA